MERGHGYTDNATRAVLGLWMTMTLIGSFGAHGVCVDFVVTPFLLMVAPFVVTLTVLIAIEIMYASEMPC